MKEQNSKRDSRGRKAAEREFQKRTHTHTHKGTDFNGKRNHEPIHVGAESWNDEIERENSAREKERMKREKIMKMYL